MVSKLKTYFDFAENDYQFFKDAYRHGMVANQMAAIAQGICEKYLKHVIEKYAVPGNEKEYDEKVAVLRTHSLSKLLKYLKEYIPDFEIRRDKIKMIDGYYFTTRYPGEESISIDQDDIEECKTAIEECRQKTYDFLKARERSEEKVLEIDKSTLPSKPKHVKKR